MIALLCALATLAVLLALRPLAGAPQNDDFSYARTAWAFAQTGRVIYNGWASPLLLPQMVAGAVILKIAGGFSYAALAWLGVLSACGAAAVMYRLARACGLSAFFSVLAVAVLALNPIFLGVAPTFMTDAPSLLLYLLALYYLASALRPVAGACATASVVKISVRPFCFSVAFALIGGMNRQIIWVAELGALAFLFFATRGKDDKRLIAIGAGVLLVVGGALSLWFARQPYTVAPDVGAGLRLAQLAPLLSLLSIYKLLNLLAIGLAPALLLASGRRRPYRLLLAGGLSLFVFAFTLAPYLIAGSVADFHESLVNPLADWLRLTVYGQYFTSHGALVGGVHGFDTRPPVWNGDISRLLVFGGAVSLAYAGVLFFSWWDAQVGAADPSEADAAAIVRRTRVSAVALSSVAQIVVSLPWYASMTVLDRYLLLLWPGLLILHLAQAGGQARGLPRPVVALAVAVAGLWAGWGIASAQEYFAYTRARAALYNRLVQRGVPRTAIDGGFEWNADTQVAAEGFVNSDQIKNPPNAYRPDARGQVAYRPGLFPAVNARYLLSTEESPSPDLVEIAAPDDRETYVSLLPPRRRTMYVYRLRRDAASEVAPPTGATPAP